MHLRNTVVAGALGLALALAAAPRAQAQNPLCSSLGQPIYVSGSSAIQPLIAQMGPPLYASGITVVYKNAGSCTGVGAIVNQTAITGTAIYYDDSGMMQNCDLPSGGQAVDVGISDVFGTSCDGVDSLPSDVKDFFGPAAAMTFVVPAASTQTALTAEEGYFVFGFGGQAGGVSPWLDVSQQFIRNTGSGTQTMTSRAVGIQPSQMQGVDANGSSGVAAMVGAATNPEPVIGILGADFYDNHRDTLKVLAFQGFGQKAAFFPDSSATSYDKKNVRDGHYVVWGPVHMLTHVDNSGAPVSAGAEAFIDYVQSVTPPDPYPAPTFNILDAQIAAHVIPTCAMHVQRTTEMGPLSPYQADAPCDCYFEANVPNGSTSCTTCSGDSDCNASTPTCRLGYCEPR